MSDLRHVAVSVSEGDTKEICSVYSALILTQQSCWQRNASADFFGDFKVPVTARRRGQNENLVEQVSHAFGSDQAAHPSRLAGLNDDGLEYMSARH